MFLLTKFMYSIKSIKEFIAFLSASNRKIKNLPYSLHTYLSNKLLRKREELMVPGFSNDKSFASKLLSKMKLSEKSCL